MKITGVAANLSFEAVSKGYLFPIGHNCSLLRITKRQFEAKAIQECSMGHVTASLTQRTFLRILNSLKTFPADGQPCGGRHWPMGQVQILNRMTTEILDPEVSSPGVEKPKIEESAAGRIFLRPTDGANLLPGLSLWPRLRPGKGGEVGFELQIDVDHATLPLIFVDIAASADPSSMHALTEYYNELFEHSGEPDARRCLQLRGDKPRSGPMTDLSINSVNMRCWAIGAEGRDDRNFDMSKLFATPESGQAPFYPKLATPMLGLIS